MNNYGYSSSYDVSRVVVVVVVVVVIVVVEQRIVIYINIMSYCMFIIYLYDLYVCYVCLWTLNLTIFTTSCNFNYSILYDILHLIPYILCSMVELIM